MSDLNRPDPAVLQQLLRPGAPLITAQAFYLQLRDVTDAALAQLIAAAPLRPACHVRAVLCRRGLLVVWFLCATGFFLYI